MGEVTNLETAAGFLAERSDFLHVYATQSVAGPGWDVVVRVDGTYAEQAAAEAAVGGIREWIDRLGDVKWARRTWWDGPPWTPK